MGVSTEPQNLQQAVYGLSALVVDGATLDEALEYVFEVFTGLIPYDRIGFADVDMEAGVVRARWSRSHGSTHLRPGFTGQLAGSSLQFVLQQRRPRILNDLPAYLDRRPNSKSTRLIVMEGVKSSMTCPLHIGETPVGLLFLSSYQTDTYNESHVQTWKEVAVTLAMLIRSTMSLAATTAASERTPAEPESPGAKPILQMISSLRPGMKLVEPLCMPGGALMIAAGTQLTQPLIDGLITLKKRGAVPADAVKVWI